MNILITGASRGIGRAAALALAEPGARLTLAARSAGPLEALAAEIRAAGAAAAAHPADLTDEAAVAQLAGAAAAAGPIDLLVHSVGGALVRPFEQISLAEWEQSLRGQLTSLFLICRAAAGHMGRGGLIINVASVAGRQAFPGWSAYSAAKHGVMGFTGAIREELRPRGIRVCSVLPAATDTSLWDEVPGEWNRGNMLRPEEVGQVIAQIARQPAHLTVEEIAIGHVAGRL